MKPYINNYADILELLDEKVESINWNSFYEERKRPVPFITQNTMPDENLVAFLHSQTGIKSAIEFGCGEGRNAIYMAKQGIKVTAYDLSAVAIENAKKIMTDAGVNVNFVCKDVIKSNITDKVDFVYDSGMFHHLSPHRRITYIELVKKILKSDGYFGLTCFSWGTNCADEITDWEYYNHKFNAGVAFTKERLIELFFPHFEIIEIRNYQNGVPNTIQGLEFMWVCLFKRT
ncbi:MAG: methyltransferase domain-containing protein [Lachnospiraceae bacterium]|nr:methyltransferase domain-containing protein [Lachnospiraceae bacterium]